MKRTLTVLLTGAVFLILQSATAVAQGEQIYIKWPEDEEWHIDEEQQDQSKSLVSYSCHDGNNEEWKVGATVYTRKNIKINSLDMIVSYLLNEAKTSCKDAKQAILDSIIIGGFKAVSLTLECPFYEGSKNYTDGPESHIYCIFQTNKNVYIVTIVNRIAKLDSEFIQKWTAVFKQTEIR
jgi:hypothetical protein